MIYASGARYEGEWRQNKFHGSGLLVDEDGNIHEGDFVANMRNGRGKMTFVADSSIAVGTWSKNVLIDGQLQLSNGVMFEGDFRDASFAGVGSIRYPNGDTY